MSRKDDIRRDLEKKGADYYARNYSVDSRANYLRRLRRTYIQESLQDVRQEVSVLDMGCGPEILYADLLEMAGRYVAVDLVKANLDEIRRNHPDEKIQLVEGDMDGFEWEAEGFDVIVCSGVIEYTESPEKNLLKMISILKEGGILVCSFPNAASPYRLWGEHVYRRLWRLKNAMLRREYHDYPRRLFSVTEISTLVDDRAKPGNATVKCFGKKFLLQPFDMLLGRLDHALTKYFEDHPRPWLRFLCSEFLLRFRK